jgi:hypothetical protein
MLVALMCGLFFLALSYAFYEMRVAVPLDADGLPRTVEAAPVVANAATGMAMTPGLRQS